MGEEGRPSTLYWRQHRKPHGKPQIRLSRFNCLDCLLVDKRCNPIKVTCSVERAMTPTSRWLAALLSFYVMVSSGASLNTFSLFSEHMKSSLGYDQEAINTIGFFKELGTAAGIVSGLVYDFSGPWLVLLLGSLLNLLGYTMIWLSTTHRIAHPEVWQLSLYICIVGASVAFTSTAVFVVCANNFPKSQSMILSLLDSTQGLSGATFTLLFQAFFTSRSNSFILLLGWFPSALPLLFIPFLRQVPAAENRGDSKTLHRFLAAVLLLAAYLLVVIVVQHTNDLSVTTVKVLFAAMLLIILVPVPIVLSRSREPAVEPNVQLAVVEQQSAALDVDEEAAAAAGGGGGTSKRPKHGDDFSIIQAVKSVDMWLIFIATTCGVGAALTVNNNLGQIGIALGYSQLQTNTFVALLSIWDFLGGVGCGFLSDVLLKKKAVPRPLFLAIVLGVQALGNLLLGLAVPGALFLGSILVGVSIGAQWAVLYTIIAEIFGLKNYGTLQNFTYVAKALGTYFLSVRLAGLLYDREAKQGHNMLVGALSPIADDGLQCLGSHCYRTSFFVMAATSLLGCLMSSFLTARTRIFYRDVVRTRLRAVA